MKLSKAINLLLLFYFLLGFTIPTYSQDSLLINFDNQYHSADDSGNGFMKLLKCPSDAEVTYYGKVHQIVFPENFNVKDSALAFSYFTGWKDSKTPKSSLFLIGNYSSYKPIVYVDYNQNLDFSDDGQPLAFSKDSTVIVYLKNSEYPTALFPVKFFYPKLNPELKKEVETFIGGSGPDAIGNTLTSVDYWLADKRMNYKVADTWINDEKMKIALYDSNCNGLYNDKGEDRIIISDYRADFISGELSKGAVVYTDKAQIEIGEYIYEIEEIEYSGKYLKLKKSKKSYKRPIEVGDELSHFKLTLLSGETKSIKQLQEQDKYLLIDFWGTWCKGCTQQLPSLKEFAETNKDKLQIIGLSARDTKEQIERYISKHKVQWTIGYADDEIIKKLRIDGFPTYMLLDKNGELLLMNGEIEAISRLIE
jgi:peroxiredoxin